MNSIVCLMLLLLVTMDLAAEDPLSGNYWTGGTALNTPPRRWELALMTPSRYGLNRRLELYAHPLLFPVLPHLGLKCGWGTVGGISLATEHGLYYPTPFMKLVSAEGTGGLISPEFAIPTMFAAWNRILGSVRPFHAAILTVHAGITLSVTSAKPDIRTTIDMPIIYPRLAVFYSQPEVDAGVDFRGMVFPRFGWVFGVQNFIVCGTKQNYFMESKGTLAYTSKKETLRVEAGYKLCFGRYPAGPQWHLLPALEVVFGIGR